MIKFEFWSNFRVFLPFFCRISRDLFSYTTRAKVHFPAWLVHIILHHCFREFPYQPNNFLAAALCLPRVCVWSKTVTKVIRYAKTGVTSFEKTRCWLIVAKKLGPIHLFFPIFFRDFRDFLRLLSDFLNIWCSLTFYSFATYGLFTVLIILPFSRFSFWRIFFRFLHFDGFFAFFWILTFCDFFRLTIFGGFFFVLFDLFTFSLSFHFDVFSTVFQFSDFSDFFRIVFCQKISTLALFVKLSCLTFHNKVFFTSKWKGSKGSRVCCSLRFSS